MIELIINDVSLDLSDRTQIGLTILSSDITNLTTRTGDFTNTFTIPATKRNMKALEHVNLMTSSSTLPYRIVRATFKQDGIEIASNAYCVINSVTVDYITLNIFTGNLDFIKELGDMTVSELYANDSSITWNRTNVISGNDDLVFPLIKWREDSTMFATTPSVDARELLPCLRLSSLLDKISDNINYSLLGSFIDSDLKNEIIITPNKFSVDVEEFEITNDKQTIFNTTNVSVAEGSGTTTLTISPVFDTPQSGEFSSNKFSPSVNRFGVLAYNGVLDFSWVQNENYGIFETIKNRNVFLTIKIKDDLGIVIKQLQSETQTGKLQLNGQFNITIESPLMTFLSTRDYFIEVVASISQHDNMPSLFRAYFKTSNLKFQSNGSLVYGNDLKVSNLFDMKVVDVIKEVINSYQIMISTDSYLQQVKFNYLDTLIENKKRSIDWSDKILTLESVGFSVPGLSKRNHLKYKESDSLPNDSNSYFDIENENLQSESNFVQLSSEMTRTFKGYNDETICLINGINSSYEFQNPQWRILEIDEKNTPYNVTYSDALGTTTNSSNVPFAIFRNFEYLKDNYFNVIQDISIDAKVVNATVKINSLDLQDVRNDLVPVWIYSDKFNIDGYFHVNKISNYKNNIAQVELIRI